MDALVESVSHSEPSTDWPTHPSILRVLRKTLAIIASTGFFNGCGTEPVEKAPRFWKPDPDRSYVVLITGRNFNWHIRYPGPDDKLGTEDDIHARRHLHLPEGTKVRLQLASDDYIYSLALPDWNLKEIAVPDLSFSLELETGNMGEFDLLGNQMCGYTHPNLIGHLTIQSHTDFNDWLHKNHNALVSPSNPPLDR